MPKKKNPENAGLPKRWQHTHGAYYYQVPPGLEAQWDHKKKFRLGKSLPEAYRTWASRLEMMDGARTIGELLDRYALEVIPTKAPRTQVENQRAIGRLRLPFSEVPLTTMRPQYAYQYVDKAEKKITAKKEIKVLSHAFTKAVEWGLIDRHPLKGELRMEGDTARTRYVEDWEIIECLSLDCKRKKGSVLMIQAYIGIKLLTGISRGDLLRIEPERDFLPEGIQVTRHKTAKTTGKTTIYEWSPELEEAVAMAIEARTAKKSNFLFCNRMGECYIHPKKETAYGWDSMWQRFMERLLSETKVKERFTEHDLRAKCASDADSLEHARMLLSHVTDSVTRKHYRRKPERVQPLKRRIE